MESYLEKVLKEARSFPELTPPNNAQEYGRVNRPSGTYIIYKDAEGNYYFDTVHGLEFKRQMETARKNKKRRCL